MAGILNSKERMIDFIVTPNGRSQMADGRMRIEFATLTDHHTFYTSSNGQGIADDASGRIFFESHSSVADTITPEIDSSSPENILKPFRAGNFLINGRDFATGTFSFETGSTHYRYRTLAGPDDAVGNAGHFMQSITRHFSGLKILGTDDSFSNNTEFDTDFSTGSFVITDVDLEKNQGNGIYLKDMNGMTTVIDNGGQTIEGNEPVDGAANLDTCPSIYKDPRFFHLPNFRHLPPLNLPLAGTSEQIPMGTYADYKQETNEFFPFSMTEHIHETDQFSGDKLLQSLEARQNIVFNFEKNSKDSNLVGQIFEFNSVHREVQKLSLIDFGVVHDPDTDEFRHVYFAGKVYRDSKHSQTFLNIFTIVFEDEKDR